MGNGFTYRLGYVIGLIISRIMNGDFVIVEVSKIIKNAPEIDWITINQLIFCSQEPRIEFLKLLKELEDFAVI